MNISCQAKLLCYDIFVLMKKSLLFLLITIGLCVCFFLILNGLNGKDVNNEELNLESTNMDFEELKITTLVEGEGVESKNGDTLVVHYSGTLKDSTKFDSSYDRGVPYKFTLGIGGVIQGWEKGMLGMKAGEKRKLEIPSSLGYGELGSGSVIPGNAGLIFEVELLEIK